MSLRNRNTFYVIHFFLYYLFYLKYYHILIQKSMTKTRLTAGPCDTYVVYDKYESYLTLTKLVYHILNKKANFYLIQQKKTLLREDFSYFWSCIYKPNSVPFGDSYLSSPSIALRVKRFLPILPTGG